MKNKKRQDLASSIICIMEFATELLMAWHVHMLFHSIMTGILSYLLVNFAYTGWTLCKAKGTLLAFDADKYKDALIQLQPYQLSINTVICVVLSWL